VSEELHDRIRKRSQLAERLRGKTIREVSFPKPEPAEDVVRIEFTDDTAVQVESWDYWFEQCLALKEERAAALDAKVDVQL
jgi:hypothetical protein